MPAPIVLITGGSRGIGAETARRAAQKGYDICFSYHNDAPAADAVLADVRGHGRRGLALRCDVADPAQVANLFAECDRRFGKLDHLINNAGMIGATGRLVDADPAMLERAIAVNLLGSLFAAQQAIKRLARSKGGKGGSIVNLSSIAAVLGSPGEYIHYAASKGAIESMTVGLAKELGQEGIRVNAVQAGTVNTDIHHREGNPNRPAMVAKIAPLGRAGSPGDIADAILFLISDQAAYITGASLKVAGGI